MKIVFRVDGGRAIGLGHLSRCAALASACASRGAEIAWACRERAAVERLIGRSPDRLLRGEVGFDALPIDEARGTGTWASDADWIVVDHYGVGAEYLEALRLAAPSARILLMDDHQERVGAHLRLAPMQEPSADTLSGPQYLLMRSCFDPEGLAPSVERDGTLVCFGGADLGGDTRKVLLGLLGHEDGIGSLTVLASDDQAVEQDLDALIEDWRGPAERLSWLNGPELAARFAAAALVVVPSSVLAFEALVMGAPVISRECTENQRFHAATLRRLGAVSVQEIDKVITLARRRAGVALPPGTLDVQGAQRVAQALMREER